MNEEDRIAATVRASKAIPGVDLIIVVDDGSTDETKLRAREAGAITVRHTINRGKASAMQTGANVAGMHDQAEGEPRLLLYLDADLGDSAAEAAPLVEPVACGRADCAIAVLPPAKGAGGHGFVLGLARSAIEKAAGWRPVAPLSGQRCMTREAFAASQPFAPGWGVETAMTIRMLVAGMTLIEVPCELGHRVSTRDFAGEMHRLRQWIDVRRAVTSLALARVRLPRARFAQAAARQRDYEPYCALGEAARGRR
ncbi:glycosyltransferase family 2 protein [Nanchangia anserum]|uniref:Glucosyl-3-phosphoglycerate synthase n=2 Tax=Nanchangia anserum TaxID=2692125 RepID=A0A8I0GC48_9ACTO|nr:glycosyltransferase family 2 protein [Nanchangia anserum]MBD3689291.1 glycosyltransferase family 2 protein [Nanchangia anserum]QOX82640.1 glycosyltransferase family 2 protein [Nanchangia anserum]